MKILETTLRDGSYAIDFQFTPNDTAIIASSLEQIGFELIEIGHGLGLHAKEMGEGDTPAPDIEYIKAASNVLKEAKFGMFCIPGIARLEDIDMAAEAGIDFIRIGTNITELEGTNKYFERAKKYGMFISSNLMKSYAVEAKNFGKYTKLAQDYGADIAVLVDSAGTFTPNDIEKYFSQSRKACNIDLGFHGHNNLGLANANTLKAVQLGAKIVDTSMKGIGRSAGNAITEMMIMILKKIGYEINIDEYAVMDLSEKYIKPIMHNVKDTPISITGGYAQFHSKFLGTIMKYSDKYNIDPRELIVKVAEKDKLHAPDEMVDSLSKNIKKEKEKSNLKQINPISLKKFRNAEKENKHSSQIKLVMNEIINRSKKKGKTSIFNIVISDNKNNFISEFIQESPLFIIGSVEINKYKYIKDILEYIDGTVEYIMLDGSIKSNKDANIISNIIKSINKSELLIYNDIYCWAKSIVIQLSSFYTSLINKNLIIHGESKLSDVIIDMLENKGANVISSNEKIRLKDIDTIISCDKKNKLNINFINKYDKIGLIVDAKINSIEKDCINWILGNNIKLIRPDMRSVLAGEALHQILNKNIMKNDFGASKIKGHKVVCAGLVGKKGDIIVDSINEPTQVIGIAKGNGEVKYSYNEKEEQIVEAIENYINSKF